MSEAMERARLRAQRRDQNRAEAARPTVRTREDVMRLVAEFAPHNQQDGRDVEIATTLEGEGEGGTVQHYRVSAMTSSKSRRTQLLEGLESVRRRQQVVELTRQQQPTVSVNGRDMAPPMLPEGDRGSYVDPLITQWFGATRQGLLICWELGDGYTYRYDPFQHRLTRSRREQ